MTTIGTVQLIATIDTSSYKRGAKEIEKTNSDIEGSADKSSKNVTKAWSTGAQLATAAVLAATALILKSFVTSGSEIQSLRASFESLTGNVDDTNRVMSTLYELGKKTAFSNKDIQTAGRSYLSTGVAIEDLNKVLGQTADIAGATGSDLGRLTLPITQAISKGRLDTRDFYQLMEAGAGALRKPLSDLAGKKGFGNLGEALEASAIKSEDLLKLIGDVTQEGGFAFGGAIKQAETFNGRMSNLQEAIRNVGLGILGVDAVTGQVDPSGIFSKLSDAVKTATGWLSENGETVKQIATVITILLIPAIVMLGVQGLIAGAKLAAGILLAMGPIGLIVAAIAAAVYLIIANWETVSKWFIGFWNWMVNAAKIALNSVIGLFSGIGQAIGNAVAGAFKFAVNSVLGFVEGYINTIIGVINGVIDLVNSVPGLPDIGKIGKLSIPRMADGGIVSKATLAVIGEGKEPEAVLPLSKLDKLMQNGGSTGSSQQITQNNTINTELDMEVVTRNLTWQLRRA